jgi:hypothetical protein
MQIIGHLYQGDEDYLPSKTATDDQPDLIDDKTFTQSSSSPQLEQEYQIKYHDGYIDNKSDGPNHNEIKNQNLNQENTLGKTSQKTDISNKEIVT